MKHPFTLGILGGAGPRSASKFLEYFLEAWAKQTKSWRDNEYPRIQLDTQAFEGLDEQGPTDLDELKFSILRGARRLQEQGCRYFVVPCFSAHIVYQPSHSDIDWFNLRHLAMGQFVDFSQETVFLEATGAVGSFKKEWDDMFCESRGTSQLQQEMVERIIRNGMANEPSINLVSQLKKLEKEDVTYILGCSELSLANWWPDRTGRIFDVLKASAVGLVKHMVELRK